MSKRYFIDSDNSSHNYLVDEAFREEWNEWNELPEDDEKSWEAPSFARRINSESSITFENPHEFGKPIEP